MCDGATSWIQTTTKSATSRPRINTSSIRCVILNGKTARPYFLWSRMMRRIVAHSYQASFRMSFWWRGITGDRKWIWPCWRWWIICCWRWGVLGGGARTWATPRRSFIFRIGRGTGAPLNDRWGRKIFSRQIGWRGRKTSRQKGISMPVFFTASLLWYNSHLVFKLFLIKFGKLSTVCVMQNILNMRWEMWMNCSFMLFGFYWCKNIRDYCTAHFRMCLWKKHCAEANLNLFHFWTWLPTRCGPYFGTTVEAVQCLTYRTEWNVRTCKKETKHTLLGGGGRKDFFTLSPSHKQSLKNREKTLCPTVLQLRWVIWTWWDENMTLFVFSACYEIHRNWFCGRKQTKMQRSKKEHFLAKGAVIGESIFQTQRINAVHGRCSSSGVLRHIPSNFTLGVRRWIVL